MTPCLNTKARYPQFRFISNVTLQKPKSLYADTTACARFQATERVSTKFTSGLQGVFWKRHKIRHTFQLERCYLSVTSLAESVILQSVTLQQHEKSHDVIFTIMYTFTGTRH